MTIRVGRTARLGCPDRRLSGERAFSASGAVARTGEGACPTQRRGSTTDAAHGAFGLDEIFFADVVAGFFGEDDLA